MITLIILTPGFPENENDTTCLPAVQKFVLSLKKVHVNSRIIVLSFQYPFKRIQYVWNGIEVIPLGGRNLPGMRRVFTWIHAYKELRRLQKDNKIIGLLSLWLGECAFVGQVFSGRAKLKHFIWLHGQDAKAHNVYVKRVKPKSEQLIAISQFIKDEFYKNYNITPFLIAENGIIETEFPSLIINQRPIDILGVGSLSKLKNYSLFIDCINELKQTYPAINAAIAGEGEEYDNLNLQIKALGLQNNIQLLGAQTHSKILEIMNQSKIFLHPSHYEGNSSALIEALYSGCLVISTCSLGPDQMKRFYVCKNKEEIVQNLFTCMNMDTNAERVIFNSMEQTAQKISDLYSSVIN